MAHLLSGRIVHQGSLKRKLPCTQHAYEFAGVHRMLQVDFLLHFFKRGGRPFRSLSARLSLSAPACAQMGGRLRERFPSI